MTKEMKRLLRAEDTTHYMVLGALEYEAKQIDVKPILTIGWLYYKDPIDAKVVEDEVMSKLTKNVFRMRSVPKMINGWTHFEEVDIEDMDMDYHFQKAGTFNTEEEWQVYLEKLSKNGLDYSKPWWRYVIVEKLPCGRSAVLGLAEHAMADGCSQICGLLRMSENQAYNPVFLGNNIPSSPGKEGGALKQKKYRGRKLTLLEKGYAFTRGLLVPIIELLQGVDSPHKFKMTPFQFPQGYKIAITQPGGEMKTSFFKDIKERIPGSTVNDVMLAVCALSIREYYKSIDEPIPAQITATFPINVRPRGADALEEKWYGNHMLIDTIKFPLLKTREQTLLFFRDTTRIMKHSPGLFVRNFFVKFLYLFPKKIVIDAIEAGTVNFSVMISNVLFSLNEVKIFGQKVDDATVLAESPLALYIGCVTYGGKVNCSMTVAEELGVDPNKVLPYFKQELIELHREIMSKDKEYYIKQDQPMSFPIGPLSIVVLVLAILFSLVERVIYHTNYPAYIVAPIVFICIAILFQQTFTTRKQQKKNIL